MHRCAVQFAKLKALRQTSMALAERSSARSTELPATARAIARAPGGPMELQDVSRPSRLRAVPDDNTSASRVAPSSPSYLATQIKTPRRNKNA